ncbi:MAG: hypothetical protein ACT4UP_09200 [Gammaproteobacteria bacterium]
MSRTGIALCASCLLGGCMSFGGGYPPDWANRTESGPGACPAIDGEYGNAGEMYQEAGAGHVKAPTSLALLLAGWADQEQQRLDFAAPDPEYDPYRSVSLRLSGDSLHVVATRAEGGNDAFDLPVRAGCEQSLVTLEPNWTVEPLMMISTIVDRSTLEFGSATDGSLLVRVKYQGGLLFMPIFTFSEKRWIRFPSTETAPAAGTVATAAVQ